MSRAFAALTTPHPRPLPLGERGLVGWVNSTLGVLFRFRSFSGGWPRVASFIDGLKTSLGVVPYLRVPKAQHQPTLLTKKLVSSPVLFTVQMLASVQLYPNPPLVAHKIGNGFFYIFLATKLEAKLAISQSIPQNSFLRRLVPPQLSGNTFQTHNLTLNPPKAINGSNPMPLAPSPLVGEGGGEG